MSDGTVASKRQVFGRIVSSIIVDPGRVDLGLNLKQNGRYQLLEYSRSVTFANWMHFLLAHETRAEDVG